MYSIHSSKRETRLNSATNLGDQLPLITPHRHDQILHHVVLPLRRVLAHVEAEELLAVYLPTRSPFKLTPQTQVPE